MVLRQLYISVKHTEFDIGRCLVNVPVCASHTEDAVNNGHRPVEEETAQPGWGMNYEQK